MEKQRMLSGHEIVTKGVTKLDASLPEVGLKDVIPNGSWLEQKQIQSALEARKNLIEVERIQKFGTLSQAIWHDELKLAEVIQKMGSYWQYMGHNVGKTLYLQPEEALFLMEANCLLLKHNGVIVSLQKAYSLMLNEINIIQYRVYASLSRIGYKILRHKIPERLNLVNQSGHNENMDLQVNKTENNVEEEIDLQNEAVNILDDKTNENNVSHIDTKNITKSQSSISNIITNTSQNMSIIEDIKNDESPNEFNYKMEIQSTIETCNDKTNTTENIHLSDYIDVSNNVHDTENIEVNNKPLQSIGTKVEITSCNDNKEGTNINSMEVNTSVKNEPNTTFNLYKKHSKTIKSLQSMLIKESNYEISDNSTDSDNINLIIVENEELSENSDANGESIIIDNKVNCDKSANVTSEVVKTDSGIQSIEMDHAAENMDLDIPISRDFKNVYNTAINYDNKTNTNSPNLFVHRREQTFVNYVNKLKKLTSRQIKQCDFKTLAKHFENIPDLFQKEIVTINVPDQQYIPRNIFVNNTSYTLNIKEIRNKFVRCDSSLSPFNNIEEVNANHLRRIRNNSRTEFNQSVHFVNNARFPRQPFYFRPIHFWRPQTNLNYVSFNMFFQRACLPNMYYPQRMPYGPRTNQFFRTIPQAPNISVNSNNSSMIDNSRKRLRSARNTHLNSIKNLAVRLKQIIMSGSNQLQNIESLHRLLVAFNNRYKARLRLTEQFDIVNDENIIETIELDDEVKSKSKRPRLSQDSDNFNENLNKLREIALKLKDLEAKNRSTSKHKRAMSKAIKTFNISYDADIYMNKDYEIIDRRYIDIVSDSESDCIITEMKKPKRKKLKNPFYILKQRSEKNAEVFPSTSQQNNIEKTAPNNFENEGNSKYSQYILDTFSENWLPNENDFGRAEVVKKNEINSHFIDINDEYLFKFLEEHYEDFGNWLEAKIAYLQHAEEMEALQNRNDMVPAVKEPMNYSGLTPLIDTEDNSDMPTILEKLRIIVNNNKIENETSLCIHFDVYNRDIQNFRKTNPPKPHFRIVCLKESSSFPSAEEVMALHSKYENNVAIVFAVVGISSISYLQIKPIDLPVYIAGKDL